MQLSLPNARVIVPDEIAAVDALSRTTELGIAAHPDDLEIMTWHGIGRCKDHDDRWFSAVTVTDGGGSPRTGRYADCSDAEMRALRFTEQTRAAKLGGYSTLVYLGLPSATVRESIHDSLVTDLASVIRAARPEVIYTHSPFDAHQTHVGILAHVIEALRGVSAHEQPRSIYGCEVWGSLEWLPRTHRVSFDVSEYAELGEKLIATHESQVAGGKRYDVATTARKRANATYRDPRTVDVATSVEYAVDLGPLLRDPSLSLVDFAAEILEGFSREIASRLHAYGS